MLQQMVYIYFLLYTYTFICLFYSQFSVPWIEYPLGGSSQKGSHVSTLLIVAMVLLLWHQIVLLWHQITKAASEQHLYQTMVLLQQEVYMTTFFATTP